MGTAAPNVGLSASGSDATPTAFGRAADLAVRAATSWAGAITAYLTTITAVVVAILNPPSPLKVIPLWARIVLLSTLPVAALVFHAIPTLVEQRRKKRLAEITGNLQAGYFRT